MREEGREEVEGVENEGGRDGEGVNYFSLSTHRQSPYPTPPTHRS